MVCSGPWQISLASGASVFPVLSLIVLRNVSDIGTCRFREGEGTNIGQVMTVPDMARYVALLPHLTFMTTQVTVTEVIVPPSFIPEESEP